MRTLRTQQRGFALTEVLLLGAAVVLVGLAGYAVLKANAKTSKTPTAAQQQQIATAPAAANVDKKSDLTDAEKTLDQTNVDTSASDSAELDTQINDL